MSIFDLYLITHYIHGNPAVQVFRDYASVELCNGLGLVLKTNLMGDKFVTDVFIFCVNSITM